MIEKMAACGLCHMMQCGNKIHKIFTQKRASKKKVVELMSVCVSGNKKPSSASQNNNDAQVAAAV